MFEVITILLINIIIFLILKNRTIRNEHNKLSQTVEELETTIEKQDDKINSLLEIYDDNVIASKTDLKGRITYASRAFCRTCEYTEEELLGKPHNIVKHPSVSKRHFVALWRDLKADKPWRGEMHNLSKSGRGYWVETIITPEFDKEGKKIGYSSVRHDITAKKELENMAKTLEEKVKERTKELEELSITDSLTGLYNRRYFEKVLQKEFKRCRRAKTNFIFAIFDVDMFKQYNDHYGHLKGDEVLIKLAEILKSFTQRANDFAFRIGGEEFCVITSGMSEDEAHEYFETIRTSIEDAHIEHEKSEASKYVTASFGLVTVNFKAITNTVFDERYDTEKIHQRADKLLYKAKAEGRNNIQVEVI